MKIVLIGSGNVAYHLAKAFSEAGITLSQIFGRNEKDLAEISTECHIPYSTQKLEDADFYLIAVSDSSVEEVSQLITKKKCLVAHTSGSLPKEILKGNYRKASFYPLQTFSKTKNLVYKEIPFFLEAKNNEDFSFMKKLTLKISPNVMKSSYEQRKYIHITAVFTCNFVNHLYARAKEITDKQDIPFQYFLPLIDETTEKIHHLTPKKAQTGPAVRNDERVLQLHEALLNKEHLEMYQLFNQSIKKMYEL